MVKRFQDKIVIVTGSSNGIGRGCALLYAEEGAKVTITGRNEESLNETKQLMLEAGGTEDSILSLIGDLINEDFQKKLIDETVEKFGGLDILINNAGGIRLGDRTDDKKGSTPEAFDYIIGLNTKTQYFFTLKAMPHLMKSQGSVVMVSSIAGLNRAYFTEPFYAASKAGLDAIMRALAVKYILKGVRINSVNPGYVLTDIWRKAGMSTNQIDDIHRVQVTDRNLVPCGYSAVPKDIAEPIAFLTDYKASRYIIGQTIVIDGGATTSINFADLNSVAF